MKFSYNILQDLVSKKLPDASRAADLLTMHTVEVEGVTKEGGDYVLDLDVLPNRAHDLVGHIGVAREAAALTGAKLKTPKMFATEKANKIEGVDVSVEDKKLCSRYMASIVKDIKVGPSPAWLRDRLEALGLNSINNVVDAANYAMLVTGQPLHAFDADKLEGNKLVVRYAKKGEKITTLDDETYKLNTSDLVIADAKNVLAVAGIKGGKTAEVDKDTKNLVLESANFDAISIRETSRALGISTDASYRFEHQIPAEFTQEGIEYLMHILKDVAEGKPQKNIIDTGSENKSKTTISLRVDYAESLLGEKLTEQKIKSVLTSLGLSVHNKKDQLHVEVPYFRPDIKREEDLVEEVGRMHGYENIAPKMPTASLYPPQRDVVDYWVRQIKSYLSSRGFNELYNYSFVGKEAVDIWGFNKKDLWELENPLSGDLKYMRPSLLMGALYVAQENLKNFPQIQTFEVGDVFSKSTKIKNQHQQTRLCLATATKKGTHEDFYELKGYLESLLDSIGVANVWFDDELTEKEEDAYSYLHPARRAQVKIGDAELGVIGQINPRVSDKSNLKGNLFVAEIDVEKLANEAEEETIYMPISQYPQIVRDISVMVPDNAKISRVTQVIDITGGELLRDVDLFDYYGEGQWLESENSSQGTSMAFHLIFQSDERTLKSEEVDKLMQKITKELQKNNWIVR